MNQLNEQGAKIVAAIRAGLAQMTPARWQEVRELEAEHEDEGEWFAPEFEAARQATKGIQWDFDGWKNVIDYLENGRGMLGGVDLRHAS